MPWTYDVDGTRKRDPVTARGMRRIGAATRDRRERVGLSQRALAHLIGMHQSTISRFERGERCGMRWSRFALMVETLGGLDFGHGFETSTEYRLFGARGLNPFPPVALEQIDVLEAELAHMRRRVEAKERERLAPTSEGAPPA